MKTTIKFLAIFHICIATTFVAKSQIKVKWTNLNVATYVTVSNDTLKKVYNRTNWCDGAESQNVLKSGQDGWVAYKVNQTNCHRALGFQSGATGTCMGSMGWGLYLNTNGNLIKMIGSAQTTLTTYAAGDSIKIERKGGKIYYKKNNTKLDSTSVSNNVDLYVDAMLYSYLAAFENVVASFDVLNITSTTPGSRCGTGTVTLGAVSSGGTINWYAASSGGTSLGTGASFVTPSISTTTNYYVSTTSDHGYTSTPRVSVTATINTIPTVSISPSSNPICNGSSTTLTASGASTYSWSGGGTGNTKVVSPTSTTVYTVTGTAANGCTNTASISITVNAKPTVTLSASPSTICNGASSTLTAGGATSYSWSGGLGTGNPKTVSPTTTTVYTVTGTDGNGCTNTATATVTVNSKPTVTLSASPSTICNGASSTLTAGGATSYSWSGGLGTGNPKTVSPTSTTVYTVTGTDGNGCTNTVTTTVTVNAKPTVTLSASPSTICNGASSTLTAGGATSYSWSGGLGTGNPKTVSPSSTTVYTVTGTDGNGCTNTATATVTVNAKPTATLSASPSTICNGASSTLTAGGATSYSWSGGLGTGNPKTVSPTSTTVYTVTGTDGNGCTNTAATTVTVNAKPTVTLSAYPSTICNGVSSTLTAGGATSYSWSGGLGTGNPKTVSPTTTTVYTVTGTNANGCTNTATTTVTVNPLPSAEAGRDTIIYNGDSIQIGSIPIAGYTYHWSPSTGLNNTNIANPWAKPAVSRYYYVTVTNTVGCTNKDSIKIGVALKMKCAASDFLNQALLNDTINEKLNTYENVISNYISTHFHAKQMWNEFTIPVVVNVINLGEPVGTGTNISDLQIISQIDALNRDFSNSASSINQYASNTHVHFCLAQIPPTGYTWPGTPGIMRYTDASASDHHMNQVGWNLLAGYGFPSNNYFNIWVVNSITDQYSTPGIQGYATMPGVPVTNIITGVVIVNQIFGDNSLYSNCPNCYNLSLINEAGKIASHEVGHFLGLYHTFDSMFGGGIACINANSTNDCTYLGDKCCDTPPELNANYGFTTINSCNTDDIPNAGGLNPYYPSTDANDMIENYMDYSPDDIRNTFTTEQGQRIQAVLAVYPTRYNLCTLDNLVYTGVDGLTGCMEPDLFSYFNVVQNTYCLNLNGPLSFTFTPSLGNGATHWNWTFAGGNPTIANNTTAAPVTVTYTTEGNYTVSLTVTDDDNNNDVFEQSINVTNCNEIETSCSNPCYGNLIVNGDFQDNTWLANTNNPYNGVNTEYTCTSQGMLVTGPNKANICNSTTVQADNSGWLCNDHDGLPNGNFWVVDGQSDALIMPPVIEAWGQVIPQASFIPNTAYTFSFWVNNIIKPTLNSYNFDPTLPQIQLKVNGSIVDFDNVNYPSNTAYIHLIPDNWVQLCYSFTTPNTPIAMNFVIQSCNPEGNGDDFALDDITLTPHMTITDKIGNETCFGSQDGVIYIFVTDGTSPYTYNWANSNGPFTPVDPTALTNLSADNYTVTATDANGCSVSESIVIGNSVTSAWPYNPYNGTSKELGSSVAVNTNVGDHDFGDVYSVGYFDGNIAFDNSLPNTYTTNGGKDIFISKFDACGDLLWSKQIGGSGADMVNKVIVDYNGDIIITGYFSNSINFGGGTRTVVGYPTSTTDLFVAKYLKDGTYSWDYTFDHNSLGLQDVGNDLVLDHTGSYVYAVGTVGASGLTGNIYVAKINETNGILSSSYTYNSSTAKGLGITYCNACGTNSKILVTGQVAGNIILYTWDAGLTTLTPNYYNITGAGQHIVSNANYAYIAGYKDVSGNHQIELITAGLSTLGTPNVITCGSALGYDAATDIQLDQNGDVFITGQFTSNPAEFPIGSGNNVYNSADPCTPPCTNDNFVAKYSVTGNVFDWISHSGSSDDETSIGMSLIGNGFGYITGGFQNSATFGSIILTASADQDMFIARIHDLGPTHGQFEKLTANDNSNNAEDNISIYPNPTNDKLNIDLSFVTDTKTKILLCDLVGNTVKVIDEGVFSKRHITTDTYNLANGVYLVKFELADKTVIKKLAIIK